MVVNAPWCLKTVLRKEKRSDASLDWVDAGFRWVEEKWQWCGCLHLDLCSWKNRDAGWCWTGKKGDKGKKADVRRMALDTKRSDAGFRNVEDQLCSWPHLDKVESIGTTNFGQALFRILKLITYFMHRYIVWTLSWPVSWLKPEEKAMPCCCQGWGEKKLKKYN